MCSIIEIVIVYNYRKVVCTIDNLSSKQFNEAVAFLQTKARPLERKLFEFEFEAGSSDQVIKELRVYQNEDGGFGNGLEPDIRCEASSALATAIGLGHLIRIGADESNIMVQKAIQYVLNTLDVDKMGWEIVPKEVESAPRAIWWNFGGDWPWGNPSAEIIGLLHHYKELVPGDFLGKLTSHAIAYINKLTTNDHHELQCLLKLKEELPIKERNKISGKLREIALNSVTIEQEKWQSYCLLPLQVVNSPESFLYESFKDIILANIQHIISTQSDDGSWKPTWEWGQFENEWEVAKREWSGVLTLNNLSVLRAFDAIQYNRIY